MLAIRLGSSTRIFPSKLFSDTFPSMLMSLYRYFLKSNRLTSPCIAIFFVVPSIKAFVASSPKSSLSSNLLSCRSLVSTLPEKWFRSLNCNCMFRCPMSEDSWECTSISSVPCPSTCAERLNPPRRVTTSGIPLMFCCSLAMRDLLTESWSISAFQSGRPSSWVAHPLPSRNSWLLSLMRRWLIFAVVPVPWN